MKVLILGSTGYIGSHLKYYFKKNQEIEVFGLNRDTKNIQKLERIDFDVIFICAGNKNSRLTEIESLLAYNSDINFIKLIKSIKYKKIIQISSILIDFTENNYTKYKIKIENYLQNNFQNVVVLRVCNLIGVNENEFFKDIFYKKLNIIPKLFLYSKGKSENVNLEDNFLNFKKEYIDINDFSKYFSNLENIKLLENKIYRVGTAKSILGQDILLELSTVFHFDFKKMTSIRSIEKGFDISTKDLVLPSPNFKDIYKNYIIQYNFNYKDN